MWGESKSNFKMKPVVSFIDSLQGKEEERWTVEAEKKHFSSRFVEREYRENKMRKEIRKKLFFFLLSTMFRSSVWSHSCDTTTSYFIFVGIFFCKKKYFCSTKNPEKRRVDLKTVFAICYPQESQHFEGCSPFSCKVTL